MNGSSNFAPLQRRIASALMPCNQKDNPLTACKRSLQSAIDGLPGLVEAVTVQIENSVRDEPPRAQLSVPAAVECSLLKTSPFWSWYLPFNIPHDARLGRGPYRGPRQWWGVSILGIPRKRPNRRSYPGPKLGLFSG